MDVEHDLIPLSEALERVTSVFQSPIMAKQRLCEALERGELAAWAEEIVLKRREQYIACYIDGNELRRPRSSASRAKTAGPRLAAS